MGLTAEEFAAKYDIGHIIPDSLMGSDHAHNKFVMLKQRNRHHGQTLSAEKVMDVGLPTMCRALLFFAEQHCLAAEHKEQIITLMRLRRPAALLRSSIQPTPIRIMT
jgi:hypothetical protein